MTVVARVLHLKRDRAFGFLSLPDGREPFFHRTACVPPGLYDDLEEGTTLVAGELIEEDPKGPRMERVTLAGVREIEQYQDELATRRVQRG